MEEKHTWDKTNQWEEELDYLKSIIIRTELVEAIKWGAPVYTLNNKNVLLLNCSICTRKKTRFITPT